MIGSEIQPTLICRIGVRSGQLVSSSPIDCQATASVTIKTSHSIAIAIVRRAPGVTRSVMIRIEVW